MAITVNINGVGRNVPTSQVNIDGVWRDVETVSNNVDGVWKVSYKIVDFIITATNRELVGYSDTITDLFIPKTFIQDGIKYKVTGIDNGAFSECVSLAYVYIPSSVTDIKYTAFDDCNNLTELDIDNENISYTFSNGALFNKNKTTLIRYFSANNDVNYDIPNSVETIGTHSFSMCDSFESIYIPDSVLNIESGAFAACNSLQNIQLSNNITVIPLSFCASCSALKTIKIPNKVTVIEDGAFSYSGLTEVYLPLSIENIKAGAFCLETLSTVYYTGTEEQWNNIDINTNGNEALINAIKVFNYTG